MDKDYCVGCRDNFYNGNNDLGVKECWCLKDAKLVMKKEVHIDQAPPLEPEGGKISRLLPQVKVCVR